MTWSLTRSGLRGARRAIDDLKNGRRPKAEDLFAGMPQGQLRSPQLKIGNSQSTYVEFELAEQHKDHKRQNAGPFTVDVEAWVCLRLLCAVIGLKNHYTTPEDTPGRPTKSYLGFGRVPTLLQRIIAGALPGERVVFAGGSQDYTRGNLGVRCNLPSATQKRTTSTRDGVISEAVEAVRSVLKSKGIVDIDAPARYQRALLTAFALLDRIKLDRHFRVPAE